MAEGSKEEVVDYSPRKRESGRERVLSLLSWRRGDPLSEQAKELTVTVIAATMIGVIYGGAVGARRSGEKYKLMNHFTKYNHPMQAQRELHSAKVLGFVGYGMRQGWRIGLFAAVFSGTKILLETYRNKEGGLNYIAGGAVAGCLYRVNMGLKPAIGGAVLGTILSLPIGIAMTGLHGLDHLASKYFPAEADNNRCGEKIDNGTTSITDSQTNNLPVHNR